MVSTPQNVVAENDYIVMEIMIGQSAQPLRHTTTVWGRMSAVNAGFCNCERGGAVIETCQGCTALVKRAWRDTQILIFPGGTCMIYES